MSLLRSLDLHGVRTSSNLILAPMSGVTDCAFRTLVRRCSGDAVGLLVSEFIAVEGLTRENEKTLAMLRFKETERPISIQIFGSDVDRMVRAAIVVEQCGADIVDINCGCPAPKVVKRGGGAGLMQTPDRLRAILSGLRGALSIPFTVKIRSGWDDRSLNAMEIGRMVEGEGAAMLAVHGRTRVQMYRDKADWSLVKELRDALSIPVTGSGDVRTPHEALRRLDGAGADAVMIGRAALGNPWIFAQTAALARGESICPPTDSERIAALRFFREALAEALDERAYKGRYRGFACRLVKGRPGGALARRAMGEAESLDEVDAIFAEFVTTGRPPLGALAAVA